MIPRDYITEWRAHAPWIQDIQVEQDLVISRALVEIFRHPLLADALAFRGGTALYKLYLKPAARYSEDIDLVQVRAEQAGPVMSALRSVLEPWLGAPRWKQTEGRVTFAYRFASEDVPPIPLRLKVETNTREHFAVHGFTNISYEVRSRWFEGACQIPTYEFDELLATKLRALYQRKKGRDLFDLATALSSGKAKPHRLPPDKRFNGFVFPEGFRTNPHAHIILSCRNDLERRWRYWFLLWALDTAPAKDDPRGLATDRYNEDLAWDLLSRGGRPWMAWNNPDRQSCFLSTLSFDGTRLAPAGTAKVQKLQTYNDVENVFVYDTKTWSRAALKAGWSKSVDVNDYTHNYWELSEHFSRLGIDDPARCYRIDPFHPGGPPSQ